MREHLMREKWNQVHTSESVAKMSSTRSQGSIESAPPIKIGEEREFSSSGIKKKHLKRGISRESPEFGDEVTVHYVGTLLDGKKFVSTEDDGEPSLTMLGVACRIIKKHKSATNGTVQVPDWNEVFKNTNLPLMVVIGSGSGRFLMWLAKRNPHSKNYLGLEIRKKLAVRVESWAKDLGLFNLHYMFANVTVSFKQLVSSYPGPLMSVFIMCPDPHFKKKHYKRRVLQKPLVDSIVDSSY